ncbi:MULTISPECIES: thiamine pyrophosphate-dependent enzyme [Acidobacterium]|uniref:thiamine pyrophosphate-dependent enzyme n=1 Tax=Acidobacterium TaxID=33973 RepID=UPI000EE734CB|nr:MULTISPECIES: thiamine pyrophosphate-dependent enzyme [Acidobacterium]HCT62097.1 hypothetical protein [Acidobacterium sp.]
MSQTAILNPESAADADVAGKHGAPLISNARLLELYAAMVRLAAREPRAQGRYEAVFAAMLAGIEAIDRITVTVPGPAAQLIENSATPLLPQPIEAPLSIATGIALTQQLQHPGAVVLAFATPDRLVPEAFREALRFAARHRLPILYVLLPSPRKLTGEDAFDWSGEAAIEGVISVPVDAHDVVALYRVAFEMMQRAREGTGPTLIDCKDIRLEKGDGNAIARMEAHLARKGLLEAGHRARITEEFLQAAGRVSRTPARRAKHTTFSA